MKNNYWIIIFVIGLVMGYLAYPIFTDRNTTSSIFTGESTVKAVPDEFVFYPRYEADAETATEANSKVAEIGNEVVEKLIELGVKESSIITDSYSSPGFEPYYLESDSDMITSSYSLTVRVDEFELAEKVLDYLSTTEVIGGLTPDSTFKDETRKKLERDAKKLAIEDARANAQDSAEALGVKLGNLISVNDQSFSYPYPLTGREDIALSTEAVAPQLSFTSPKLLTGKQDVSYFVTVEYELKN